MQRQDISDKHLLRVTFGLLAALAAWFLLRPWLPEPWRTPGSRELYLTGAAGALLLLVPAAFALAKRSASPDPRSWFKAHVYASLLGTLLVAIHSAGLLRRPPALLLLALVALAALGVWARVRGARLMAATFASKTHVFAPPGAGARARLGALIEEKSRLLARLDPSANEGTFSVTLPHLIKRPRLALAYRRLEREESRLVGAREALSRAQAWWRPLHLLLAWAFVLGVLIHVVTVTFFAGYVAGGGPITWWHLADWGSRW